MKRSGSGRLVSLSSVLGEHVRSAPWLVRLQQARRLFATVVGPELSKDADVTGLYGEDLVITVRRVAAIRMLQEVEPYLLNTLCECLDGRVVRCRYRVDEHLSREASVGVPTARTQPELSTGDINAIEQAIEPLRDPDLSRAAASWFATVLANRRSHSTS